MSFSFGSPSPAPSTSFSFGSSSTPAPAPPSTGFSFGSTTPAAPAAPTPATSTFSFGASSTTPAPAPAFGSTPAPTGTFSFGSTTATTPAPSTTPLFGAPPAAPAPAFGGFGSPAPAPFGAPPAPNAAQQAAPAAPITVSGNTPYSSLPPEVRKAIDTIHEAMMKHKRTISNLQTMAPKLLLSNKPKEADFAAGSPGQQSTPSLAATLVELQMKLTALEQETLQQAPQAEHLKSQFEHLAKQAILFGKWPVEALAVRRGVRLTQPPLQQQAGSAGAKPNDANANKSKETKAKLEAILDRQMAYVDGIERMPSPYLWQVLQDMESRLQILANQVEALDKIRQRTSLADHSNQTSVVSTVQSQHQALCRVSAGIVNLHAQVEHLRRQYRYVEKGENVLDKADYEEQEKLRKLDDQIRMQYVRAAAAAQPPPPAAPAPGLFGASPAPSTSLFGQSRAAPAPSLFGAKAPAPSLFGQTPAPSLFGAAPAPPAFGAPAPAPLFGQTPAAPAPAFGAAPAPAFGATTPAPAFGATPAPPAFGATTPAPAFGAPAPTPAFGAAPAPTPAFGAAPAPTFGFSANKTSSSATTPIKSKNKSRSNRRR